MAGPGTHHDSLDRCPTVGARLIGASIHPKLGHVVPGIAIGEEIGEVIEGGPSVGDGNFEHDTDGVEEATEVLDGQIAPTGQRVDPCEVKGLVGIDVPQTGDRALVQQQRLDRCRAAGETVGQPCRRGWIDPGIRPETTDPGVGQVVIVVDRDEPERPRVDELHDGAVVEAGDEVGMRHLSHRVERPPPRHTEMGDHGLAVVETQFEEFALASHLVDTPPLQPGDDLIRGGVVTGGPGVRNLHILEDAAQQRRFQVASGHLDFRKFRQCSLQTGMSGEQARHKYRNPVMVIAPRQFGQVLNDAMLGLGAVWKTLLGPAVVVFIPVSVITVWVFTATGAADFLETLLNTPGSLQTLPEQVIAEMAEPLFWAAGISSFLQLLAAVFVALASHAAVAAHIRGEPLTSGEAARQALRRYPAAIGATLLITLVVLVLVGLGVVVWLGPMTSVGTPNDASVMVALLLLAALLGPGLWVSVATSMTTSALTIESSRALDSIRRSMRLVRGRWWPTAGYLILVGLLGGIAIQLIQLVALPLALVGGGGSALSIASILGVVAQGLLVAGIAAMYTHWYVDLRARRETLSSESLG